MRCWLFALVALTASACTEKRDVHLAFARAGDGYYRGFRCIDLDAAQPGPLWQRAFDQENWVVRISLVVDLISLGGTPDCRPSQLRDWCDENGCDALLDNRACISMDVEMPPPSSFEDQLHLAIEGLSGIPLIENTPDEPVLVRVVATAETCDQIAADGSFVEDSLVGCMYSCPALLDEQTQDLILDLDVDGTHCEEEIIACANPSFHFPPVE